MVFLRYNHTLYLAESAHTTGVGTFVYAAPEQLKGSHYDSKVNKKYYSMDIMNREWN